MKHRVEAILFTLSRFTTAEEIAKILNHPPAKVKQILEKLEKEYSSRDSAITLQKQENKYKLNIKKEFGHLANKLVSDAELDSPTTKTLAVIAYKAPIKQSIIIKIRGNKAYEHIKSLVESTLVSSEKQGRTRLLKLTHHFYNYFDIAEKEVKEKLNQTIKSEEKCKS